MKIEEQFGTNGKGLAGSFKDTGSGLMELTLFTAPTATGGTDATTYSEGRSVTVLRKNTYLESNAVG